MVQNWSRNAPPESRVLPLKARERVLYSPHFKLINISLGGELTYLPEDTPEPRHPEP